MTKDKLCAYTHITRNRSAGRGGCGVCKITSHYMAAGGVAGSARTTSLGRLGRRPRTTASGSTATWP